jgi:hypothetical protein
VQTKAKPERWLWYTPRTRLCVPLDPSAYQSTIVNGRAAPLPDWACLQPNGGRHVSYGVGRIDVEVAKSPTPRIEINWTCDYGVHIIAKSWLAEIEDLIDDSRIFIGEVRRNGRPLDRWVTINERWAPPLLASEGRGMQCPQCGSVYLSLWGRLYFADPNVVGRPLIVNHKGIFVREDLALGRNLRKPKGAFKPPAIRFDPRGPTTFLSIPDRVRETTAWEDVKTIIAETLGAGRAQSLHTRVTLMLAATIGYLGAVILFLPTGHSPFDWLTPALLVAGWATVLHQWLRARRAAQAARG